MDQNKSKILLLGATAASVLFAVALFVFGIIYDGGAFAKAVLFVAAAVLLLIGVEIGYFFLISRNVKPNYFLFNSSLNMNIPVSKLTFDIVDKKTNKYLSGFAKSEAKIWTDGILENNRSVILREFRPIIAYKLLFDIAESDSEGAWKCFVLASQKTVDCIAEGVAQNGDVQLGAAIRQLKAANPVNMKQTREFLISNKPYIKKKLFNYVLENIEKFQ